MDILQRYKILREAGKKLYGKILKTVPKKVYMQVANEFHFLKRGTIVCDESEIDVVSDRLFYDKKWEGKGSVEHYIGENGEASLTESEREFYQAMKDNRFSMFEIKAITDADSIILNDRLDSESGDIRLIDINLSLTAEPEMLLATRLLNFGDFRITSGIGYPFSREHEKKILDYLKDKDLFRSKKRKNIPENYPVYFYKLHKMFGQKIRFEDVI